MQFRHCTSSQWQKLFALGQPGGLFPDMVMAAHCRGERQGETLALGLTQGAFSWVREEPLWPLAPKGCDAGLQLQELVFGLTDVASLRLALAPDNGGQSHA